MEHMCVKGITLSFSPRLSIISEKGYCGFYFKVGDLGIFVCTRAVVSYIWVSFFHSRSMVRVTFQSLGMSVFWVKNESVWSVMTTCNGI